MPQRVNENGDPLRSEKSYIMMRGFGLILLRDIVEGYAREFKPFLTDVDEFGIHLDQLIHVETVVYFKFKRAR